MLLKSPTEQPIAFGTKNGSGHCMCLDSKGTDVPQMLVQAAFAAGAIPIDSEETEFVALPEDTVTKSTMDSIMDGIKIMLERKEEKDFTASGMPDRRVLSKVAGLNVTAEELTVAWRKLNESV